MSSALRSYPHYRGTGLSWLPKLPSHWEVRRNGNLFAERREIGFPDLPILEVSLRTGVRIRDMENSTRKQVISDRSVYQRACYGDLAYNMMRMWQGAVGVAPADGLISPAYVVARPYALTNSRYYSYLFRTSGYMAQVDTYSRGIVKDRNRLYWDGFKQMPSPCPPPAEQAAIVRFLDHAVRRVSHLIRCKRRLIALLDEQWEVMTHHLITGGLDRDLPPRLSPISWPPRIPSSWTLVRGGDLAQCIQTGPFGSQLHASEVTR